MEIVKISKTSSIIKNLVKLIDENPILNLKIPFTKNFGIKTKFIIESDLELISPAIEEYFKNENFRYYISVKYYKNQIRLDEIIKLMNIDENKYMSYKDGIICILEEKVKYSEEIPDKIYICKKNNIWRDVLPCIPIRM